MFYRVRTVMFLLLLGVGSIVLAGCTAQTDSVNEEDKKVRMIFSFNSPDLDPHNIFTPLRAGITETLLKLDEELNIEGWLATEWEATDETTWVFTIREDVTFHDGTKLDAAAVKASFERGIRESEALAGALKIESMEADGQTFTIRTTEPHPSLPSELVNPYASIIQAKAEEEMGTKAFNKSPVGTGPFQVKSFKPNAEVVLERYDDYWAGTPQLKEATIQFNEDPNVRALALQSGEADIAFNLPAESVEAIEADEQLKVESIPSLRVHFILYNQRKEQMQDRVVRSALNLLLDRESIARDIMQGHAIPANGPYNPDLPFGSEEAAVKPDIAKAKEMLKKAGYEEDDRGLLVKDGKPLTLEMVTFEARPELPLIAQLLQSDAKKAGITIQIKTVEDVDNYLKENEEWDLATYSNLTAPRGDGAYFLNTALVPGGAFNAGKIDIPKLNAIVKELNATSEIEERTDITKRAVEILLEEVPHSYAVFPHNIVGINQRITGWKPGAEEYYVLTHTMDVKEDVAGR